MLGRAQEILYSKARIAPNVHPRLSLETSQESSERTRVIEGVTTRDGDPIEERVTLYLCDDIP